MSEEHVDFLQARLTGPQAEGEWQQFVRGAWAEFTELRVEDLLDQMDFSPRSDAEVGAVREFVAVAMAGVSEAVEFARTDDEPAGRFLSDELVGRWSLFVRRPDSIQEAWIREVFEQSAVEHLVSDTLFSVLQDFGQSVPKILDGLTPPALGRLAKLGRAGAGLIGPKIKDEFERRLEPEIRKFLERGTRRAVREGSAFAVRHIDDDFSLESKERLFRFALEKSPSFHVEKASEAVQEEIEGLMQDTLSELLSSKAYLGYLAGVCDWFKQRHQDETVGGFLTSRGVDFDAVPVLLSEQFPIWCALVRSESAKPWLRAVASDLAEHVR